MQWFSNNQMKANADICHLLTSSNKESTICIDNSIIMSSKCEKQLGVKIDLKVTFNAHINDICKKAGQKLSAFSRITPCIDIPKRQFLLNALFLSQISYCPLVQMCHRCSTNHKTNRLHERCF